VSLPTEWRRWVMMNKKFLTIPHINSLRMISFTVTGGLGPTHDDITRAVVCKFFNTDLVLDNEALENVKRIFARLSTLPRKVNEDQALVTSHVHRHPEPAWHCTRVLLRTWMANSFCHARCSLWNEGDDGWLCDPVSQKQNTGLVIRHLTLKTTGIADHFLPNKLEMWKIYFSRFRCHARVPPKSAWSTPAPLQLKQNLLIELNILFGMLKRNYEPSREYIYASGDRELEDVSAHYWKNASSHCCRRIMPEDLDHWPNNKYFRKFRIFWTRMTTYSNKSKKSMNSVFHPIFIKQYGAVSRQVAEAMAFGIRTKSINWHRNFYNGVAGPTGGSAEKTRGLYGLDIR